MYDLCIQPYALDSHLEMLRWLCLQRHLSPSIAYEAPKRGYIVLDECNYPVAAGFLRICEGNYAFVDGLVTDPAQPSGKRDKALDMLIKKLVKRAKGRNLMAFTVDNGILLRAKKHGFAQMPHYFVIREGSK